MVTSRSFRPVLAFFVASVLACDSTVPGTLELSVPDSAVQLSQGATTQVEVVVTRSELSDDPSFELSGLPRGVIGSVTMESDGNAVITMTATPTAIPGEARVTLHGRAAGAKAANVAFPMTVVVTGTYSIGTPATATAIQGATATAALTIAREGGFAQDVALAVIGMPDGVVATIDSTSATTAKVTFSVRSSVPVGSYEIAVGGMSPGLAARAGSLHLVVLPPPANRITLDPGSLVVRRGDVTDVTVIVGRPNPPDGVALSATGLPDGVTASFGSTTVDGDVASTIMTLTAGIDAALGSANVTVTAAGPGATARVATLGMTVEERPAIAISLGADESAIAQGGTQTANITLARTNYTGDVGLSVAGLPAGVSASFDAATLDESTTSSTITFTATNVATPGTATVTVTAVGAGVTTATATLALTVTVTGTYSLSATSTNVFAGSSGTSSVMITRNGGFAQNVDLTVSGLPSGVTASFAPSSVGGTSSVLTLTASAGAATGAATLTVHGATPGLPEQTATVTLTIYTPAPISIDFCAGHVAWAAYKNEGADWVRVFPDANNTVSFVATPKVAFAFVDNFNNGPTSFVTVRYLAAPELAALSGYECLELPPQSVRNVPVSGFSSSQEHALLAAGLNFSVIAGPAGGGTATARPSWPTSGIGDQVVLRETSPLSASQQVFNNADRATVRRGVDLGAATSFDLTSSEFLSTATFAYSISGVVGGEASSAQLFFFTHSGLDNSIPTQARVWTPTNAPASSGTVPAIPASLVVGTDRHQFTFTSQAPFVGLTVKSRSVISTFTNPANQTLGLGMAINTPTVSLLSTTGTLRYRMQVGGQSDYSALMTMSVSNSGGNRTNIDVSAAYLGGTPSTWDVAIPDFAGVDGWNPAWGAQHGKTSSVTVEAFSAVAFDVKIRRQWAAGSAVKSAFWRVLGLTP